MNFLKTAIRLKRCTLCPIVQKMKKILRAVLEESPKYIIFDTNPQLSRDNFFKNLALSLLNIHSILHSCKVLEKSLERFLRKTMADGRGLR